MLLLCVGTLAAWVGQLLHRLVLSTAAATAATDGRTQAELTSNSATECIQTIITAIHKVTVALTV
jgi:hypothetical protein